VLPLLPRQELIVPDLLEDAAVRRLLLEPEQEDPVTPEDEIAMKTSNWKVNRSSESKTHQQVQPRKA
jgi:hypothetical protein